MTRQDECDALLDIVYKLYGGDASAKKFPLAKTPAPIKQFLRRRPSRKLLNAAYLAIYTAVKAMDRREGRRADP